MMIKQLLLAATLICTSLIAVEAGAHAKLQTSSPQAGAILEQAPKEIRLQFNESLEAPFSKLKLLDAKNADVPLSNVEVDKANPKTLRAVVPSLPAGEYKVQWSTMTQDGHKTKGEFSFKVK